MTGSRHEPTPSDDVDPTGVRALLANLPDPGPMPDELVARISHSLELEQQRRAGGGFGRTVAAGSAAPGAGESGAAESGAEASSQPGASVESGTMVSAADDGSVVSLAAERARRRPGRTLMWLGGVAAVAMVATVSVNQLVGDGDTDAGVSAQYPAASDSGTDEADGDDAADAAGSDESSEEAEDGAGAPADESGGELTQGDSSGSEATGETELDDVAPLPDGTTIVGLEGTIALTTTGWADQVSALMASGPVERELAAGEGWDCLTASTVRADDAERFVLSTARWGEADARLVVAVHAEEDLAWVLSPDCQEILSGPVTLAP